MLLLDSATTLRTVQHDPVDRKSFEKDAWQIGVDRYIASLPPDLKLAFQAPADSDDCLRILQQCQSRRKFDKVVAIFQPLILPLKRLEASIDVLVQTYSTVASPIWGPIRIIITIASARLTSLHNVVLLLERLVDPLRRFHNYEALFRDNVPLRHAIGVLYCDLIEFCARLSSHSTKSPLRKTFGSFDKDISEISDKIRHHWSEVDVAANAANLAEAKTARSKEEDQRVLDMRRDINMWLAPSNVQDDLARLAAACAPESCAWLMSTPEIKAFREYKNSTSLRVCASPGGGKSVAAAYLVEELQAYDASVVSYFFCRSADAEKSYSTSIVRTLAWQMLQADPSLYEEVAHLYHRSGRHVADSESLVFEVFNTIIDRHCCTTLHIVVDALDECHDTTSLMSVLTSATLNPCKNIKLLVTSRDDPNLAESLSFFEATLFLQSNLLPLEQYIKDGVDQLALPLTSQKRGELTHTLQGSSKGLWLFAKLILEELVKASSVQEVDRQMQVVPDGLAQLYNSILLKREKHYTKTQLKMVKQIYVWIRVSDYLPSVQWRAQGTNGLSDEVLDIVLKYAANSHSEIFNSMDLVVQLCSPLVTTRLLHGNHVVSYLNNEPMHCTSFVAEFFHQTAEAYLQWCSEASASQLPACAAPRRLAELHRGACAAWYFHQSKHFQHSLHHLQERPRSETDECWLEMSSALWQALNLEKLRKDQTTEELIEVEELCESLTAFMESDQCLGFLEASIILHYSGHSDLLSQNVRSDNCDVLLTPTSSRSRPDFFRAFMDARDVFKADIAYCLDRLPATQVLTESNESELKETPSFPRGRRARKIFALARRYRWLALRPGAVSMNGFLSGSKR